jgi:uncharacterized protein YidB (DUF937 family)
MDTLMSRPAGDRSAPHQKEGISMAGLYESLKGLISGDENVSKMLDTVRNAIDEHGLDAVLEKFKASGFDDKVQSWISKGKNAALSADEVKSALGGELDKYAAKAGVAKDQAADGIAKALPELVDKLTPDGVVPSADKVKTELSSLRR